MSDDRLGKYRLLSELGRGGFATVYRALDTELEREVALKVLHPTLLADPAWVARFRQEAKAVAKLRHPHIVVLYEVGAAGDRLYLAMDLIAGPHLGARLAAQGPLPWDTALDILRQTADALDYAHGAGLIHRDIKPGNILLDPRAGVILSDFGFAKLVGENSISLSLSGGVVGTPAYIAPEIWGGEEATPQTDLYALACVTYEMLTGAVLFAGKTPSVIMRRHLIDGPQFPATWPAGAPAGLTDALRQALARAPEQRFKSVGDFLGALAGLGVARSGDRPQPGKSRPQRARAKRAGEDAGPTGDVWISPIDGKTMVRVPAGEFLYGEGKEKEALPEFWIDKTPVTNAEYKRFLDANPKHPVPFEDSGWTRSYNWDREKRLYPPDKADHPVVLVSWHDAAAYATWAGKRLPNEKQWEKAARGTDGREYPWGNDEPDGYLCNSSRTGYGTTPVGACSPQGDSPYGCVDMAGNVWEWTISEEADNKVVRGGSWYLDEGYVRAALRHSSTPTYRLGSVGFRCIAVRQD